jgi:pimeloyl-ACP methyl ester carboxylesterase
VAAAVADILVYMYLNQDRMDIPRRQYRPDYQAMLPPRAVPLEYTISCGKQKSWYVPPKSAAEPTHAPARVWLLFGGNASLALFWEETVMNSPDEDAAYILFDYPGYGFCEGTPTAKSIAEAAEAVVDQAAAYVGDAPAEFRQRPFGLMGHSLGTGMALQYAVAHPIEKIILIAPFTSTRAMANRMVTPLFGWILRHNIDNMAMLRQIAAKTDPPKVTVIHGSADEIVPVQMGRQIKEAFPNLVEYIEVKGADHTNILDGIEKYTTGTLDEESSL